MGRRDCSIFAIFVLKLPFPLIVLTAGIVGYLASKKYPELFSSAGGHKASQKDYGPAYIDDDTPTPEHAKFHWSRLARLIFVAIALWLLPILALGAYFGWHHSYTQMAWFSLKLRCLRLGALTRFYLMSIKGLSIILVGFHLHK